MTPAVEIAGSRARPIGRSTGWVVLVAAVLMFAGVVLANAWLSDDAYITLRTVNNFLDGQGLRFNVAERVQTYTHPLWMWLLAASCAVTGEYYFAPIFLSVAVATAAAGMLAFGVSPSLLAGVASLAVLTSSKAVVDFSTSGLENPLSHLLVIGFFWLYTRRAAHQRHFTALAFLASLAVLTRHDLSLVVLPALAWLAFHAGLRPTASSLARGAVPVVAWEAFSIVYYGFPVPNTAYAKLGTGIHVSAAMAAGYQYLLDSLHRDPLTLAATAVGLLVPAPRCAGSGDRGDARREAPADWPLRVAIVLYLAYALWIGGDFMSGRFLTVPLVIAVIRLARWLGTARAVSTVAVAVLAFVVGILSPTPTLFANHNYSLGEPVSLAFSPHEISDERRFYWQLTGLFSPARGTSPEPTFKRLGEEARSNRTRLAVRVAIGLHGFYAGPGLHLVDAYGLSDPLLARLPPVAFWRVGHYRRAIPAGYLETLRGDGDVIQDAGVRAFYDHLRSITRGPIWSSGRWGEIVRMNLGAYDYLLSNAAAANSTAK